MPTPLREPPRNCEPISSAVNIDNSIYRHLVYISFLGELRITVSGGQKTPVRAQIDGLAGAVVSTLRFPLGFSLVCRGHCRALRVPTASPATRALSVYLDMPAAAGCAWQFVSTTPVGSRALSVPGVFTTPSPAANGLPLSPRLRCESSLELQRRVSHGMWQPRSSGGRRCCRFVRFLLAARVRASTALECGQRGFFPAFAAAFRAAVVNQILLYRIVRCDLQYSERAPPLPSLGTHTRYA